MQTALLFAHFSLLRAVLYALWSSVGATSVVGHAEPRLERTPLRVGRAGDMSGAFGSKSLGLGRWNAPWRS